MLVVPNHTGFRRSRKLKININKEIQSPLPNTTDSYLMGLHFRFRSCALRYHQFRSVAQSFPALCDPMDCSTPGFPVLHYLPESARLMSIESVIPSNHLILCRHLLLLPSIFPSIRVLSNESVLHIRWRKYWSVELGRRWWRNRTGRPLSPLQIHQKNS